MVTQMLPASDEVKMLPGLATATSLPPSDETATAVQLMEVKNVAHELPALIETYSAPFRVPANKIFPSAEDASACQ